MKAILTSLAVASLIIAGCSVATHPDAIMPKQETNKYQKYSCAELESKANEITTQTIGLKKKLQYNADYDAGAYITGMLIAWPALLAIQGDAKNTTELYSKVKGELLNIQEADMLNNCNIQFSKDTFRYSKYTLNYEGRIMKLKRVLARSISPDMECIQQTP